MSEAHEDQPTADVVALQAAVDQMTADAKAHPAAAHEAARETALRDVLRRYAVPDRALLGKLPKVTCPNCSKGQCTEHRKEKCRECGAFISPRHVHLDYLGHAEMTAILIAVDPLWSWEPNAWADDGGPRLRANGKMVELWGKVTVLGKTIHAVGTCEAGKPEVSKELIGDLLRNAGLRFGIATSLWSKSEWDMDAIAGPAEHHDPAPERSTSRPAPERSTAPPPDRPVPARPATPAAPQPAPAARGGAATGWIAAVFDEACSTGHGRTRLLSASRDMAREAGVDLPKTVDDVRAHPMAEQFAAWAAENLHAQAS